MVTPRDGLPDRLDGYGLPSGMVRFGQVTGDGTAWTEVPNPALPSSLAYFGGLCAVTALGSGDV